MSRLLRYGALCTLICVSGGSASREPESTMSKAARAFLGTLSPSLKGEAVHPFAGELRKDWAFTPRTRIGVDWGDLNGAQREAARELLRASLSEKGIKKEAAIRTLESVLRDLEGPHRDPEAYVFTFFGEPSDEIPWAWRYEGHHISLSFTILRGTVAASTPQFLGSNPAEVRSGPQKGLRAMPDEEDLARSFLLALTAEERKAAMVSDRAPADILTSNQRKASPLDPLGVPFRSLGSQARERLKALVRLHAEAQRQEEQARRLRRIGDKGWDDVRFAWMGGLEKGKGHYYRIQGPTFLIEYDNTQNGANHVHTVWRDFSGDFGEDSLAEHYRTARHHRNR